MVERRAAFVAVLVLIGAPARAHVQDYQIVRLLSYKSTCRLEKLERRPAAAGALRYFATCENVTFYPDGIDILCTDPEDEQSCKVTTPAKSLDNLRLLDRH